MSERQSPSSLTADPLYALTMDRICDLRTEAARGRDYRRIAAAAK